MRRVTRHGRVTQAYRFVYRQGDRRVLSHKRIRFCETGDAQGGIGTAIGTANAMGICASGTGCAHAAGKPNDTLNSVDWTPKIVATRLRNMLAKQNREE